jgi:hypothetical protein
MALTESLSSFLAEIKANPRLRLGLWLIIGIVWLYGVLLLRDEARHTASEHQVLARKVARAQAQAAQTEWTERVEPAQAVQLKLENRLWRENTIGLAQAAFQDWLNQAVQQATLTRPMVTVAAQEESAPEKNATGATETGMNGDIWKVSAKVGFDFTPKGLYALMGRLSGHDKQIVVETLIVRGAPSPRAEMVLVAHFQKPSAQENMAEAGKANIHKDRP